MGHLGFSYIGLIFLLMLTIPNLIWTRNQPIAYDFQDESKILLIFERVGQVLVSCTAIIFSDRNLCSSSLWTLWLIAAVILMLMYECQWASYFKSQKSKSQCVSLSCPLPVNKYYFLISRPGGIIHYTQQTTHLCMFATHEVCYYCSISRNTLLL